MKQHWLFWGILAASIFVAGCAGTVEREGEAVPGEADERTAVEEGAETEGARMDGAFTGSPLDDPESPLSQRVFYFDFDSSELSEADREVLVAHGRFLASNPEVSVVVEGHADERGTREYNLALGERRAQAVEQLLLFQAVAENQLQVISFGEERPAAMGHDESAWRLNRRVELLYSGY